MSSELPNNIAHYKCALDIVQGLLSKSTITKEASFYEQSETEKSQNQYALEGPVDGGVDDLFETANEEDQDPEVFQEAQLSARKS